MPKEVKIIESASENGAGKRGASLGPAAIFLEARQQNLDIFDNRGWVISQDFNDEFYPEHHTPYARNIQSILKAFRQSGETIEAVLRDDYFPLIFSGDHSNAIGTISGVKNFYNTDRLGVIWVDAHLDLHSPYTTPSGNMHGMALNPLLNKDNLENARNQPAQLTEDLWNELKTLGSHKICPKISPADIVYIGIRDFEKEEWSLIEKYGIRVYTPEEVNKKGVNKVLDEVLAYLSGCEHIYTSFDVDSMDTSISRGTGTPVDGGLTMEQADAIFKTLFHHEKVRAFEITEVNPLLDCNNEMARTVVNLLKGVL